MTQPIKNDQILDFLNTKAPGLKCPSCGAKTFDIHNEEANSSRVGVVAFKFPAHDLGGTQVFDSVMIACVNCGSILQFARRTITTWLSANKK